MWWGVELGKVAGTAVEVESAVKSGVQLLRVILQTARVTHAHRKHRFTGNLTRMEGPGIESSSNIVSGRRRQWCGGFRGDGLEVEVGRGERALEVVIRRQCACCGILGQNTGRPKRPLLHA